jgi:hypothetical protein
MLTRSIVFCIAAFAGLPAFAATEPLDITNLIDLSGFTFKVVGVRAVNEKLELENPIGAPSVLTIKDENKTTNHFVIIAFRGQADRDGAFIMSPHTFVAEFVSANSWKCEPALALGLKDKKRTFWAQSSLAVTMSVDAGKKGDEKTFEVVFILPRDVNTIRLGTTKFFPESVAITKP